jgi:CubicO group peptidase (beta-lactamase class C family)
MKALHRTLSDSLSARVAAGLAAVLLMAAGPPGCGGSREEGVSEERPPAVVDALSGKNPQRRADLRAYMDAAVDVWDFSGAVLVARGDEVLLREGYGYAQHATREPNRPGTRFMIGSATKIFTALAVMQLVEAGHLRLEDRLTRYLPDYPAEVAGNVTLHHLLCHASGIPDVLGVPAFRAHPAEPMAPAAMTDLIKNEPRQFEPGTRYAYSNSNYLLLARIVESVSGLSWAEYVQQNICAPIRMTSTGVFSGLFDEATAIEAGIAIGYLPTPDADPTAAPPYHGTRGFGAGDIAATVDDLYRLDRALVRNDLVSAATLERMLTPQAENYGYGWMVRRMGDHTLTVHGGGVPGQVCMIQRWIDDSVFVAVLANQARLPVHTIATGLAAVVMGEPYEQPRIKEPQLLSREELAAYQGRYELSSGAVWQIQLRDVGLVVIRSEGPPHPILPEGRDRFFFAHDHLATLEFFRDDHGRIIGQVLRQTLEADTTRRVGD